MSEELVNLSGAVAAGGICVGIGIHAGDPGPVAIGVALWLLTCAVWMCTS